MSKTKTTTEATGSQDGLVRRLRETASKGLATCTSGNGDPKIVIEFGDLRECQECYAVLVALWGGIYQSPNAQASATTEDQR